VDPFVIVMAGLLAALVVFVLLLGRFYPGSGAEQLDWRPTRSAELEVQNEIDDHDQMRAAINAKRAKRGAPPLGEDEIELRVAEDLRASIARHEDPADEAQLRAALEARRRARRERAR
jgi:hypothetical protein